MYSQCGLSEAEMPECGRALGGCGGTCEDGSRHSKGLMLRQMNHRELLKAWPMGGHDCISLWSREEGRQKDQVEPAEER